MQNTHQRKKFELNHSLPGQEESDEICEAMNFDDVKGGELLVQWARDARKRLPPDSTSMGGASERCPSVWCQVDAMTCSQPLHFL